jgi:hypothetical protein
MACEKAVAGFWRTFPHVEPALQESLIRMPSPRQSLHGVKWWLSWWLFILNSLTLFCNTLQGHTRVSCLNYSTLQLTALCCSFGKSHPESDVLPIERPPSLLTTRSLPKSALGQKGQSQPGCASAPLQIGAAGAAVLNAELMAAEGLLS